MYEFILIQDWTCESCWHNIAAWQHKETGKYVCNQCKNKGKK